MRPPNRKTITFVVTLIGMTVLLAAAFALKRPIVERWYLSELESEDESTRKAAAERLGEMRSVRAIPRLVELLPRKLPFADLMERGPEVHYSSKALAAVGADAVPVLTELIDSGGIPSRTADVLFFILGDAGEAAIPYLVGALKGRNARTRGISARVLTRIGQPAVAELIVVLRSDNVENRIAAADVLGRIGPDAKAALPFLSEASENRKASATQRTPTYSDPSRKARKNRLRRLLDDRRWSTLSQVANRAVRQIRGELKTGWSPGDSLAH